MTWSEEILQHIPKHGGRGFIAIARAFLILCVLVNFVSSGYLMSENTRSFENERGNAGTTENVKDDDSEFDWQLSTDNGDLYRMLSRLDLEKIISWLENTSDDMVEDVTARRRRSPKTIFHKDNRRKIPMKKFAKTMPYAAAVKISSKCTGTLIGPRHVLTAAHCAFNDRGRKKKRLRVGLVNRNGVTRWRKVREVKVDNNWHKIRKKSKKSNYDYAVLGIRGKPFGRSYMRPIVYNKKKDSTLQFNGFPNDKQGMWYSSCRTSIEYNGFLLNRCDMAPGMSGSGTFLKRKDKTFAVRGIVIAAVKLKKGNRFYRFNVINPLTTSKRQKICEWMKAGANC